MQPPYNTLSGCYYSKNFELRRDYERTQIYFRLSALHTSTARHGTTYHEPRNKNTVDVPTGWRVSDAKQGIYFLTGVNPKGVQRIMFDEGHILFGALTDVTSGPSAFKTALAKTRGHFDASIHLLSVVRGKDNPNLSMASFSAVRAGAVVGGLVVSVYDPDGNSHYGVLYDAPDHLAKSLPTLLKRFDDNTQTMLEGARSQGGKTTVDFAGFERASHNVALNRTEFPDGTASIGIAQGFTPSSMSVGSFSAASADGAYINLYNPRPILDPSSSLYQSMLSIGRNGGGSGPPQIPGQIVIAYDADPVNAWVKYVAEQARQQRKPNPSPQGIQQAVIEGLAPGWNGRNVSGTITWSGVPYVFTGTLLERV